MQSTSSLPSFPISFTQFYLNNNNNNNNNTSNHSKYIKIEKNNINNHINNISSNYFDKKSYSFDSIYHSELKQYKDKVSWDDLDLLESNINININNNSLPTPSDTRILYRKWRTGNSTGAHFTSPINQQFISSFNEQDKKETTIDNNTMFIQSHTPDRSAPNFHPGDICQIPSICSFDQQVSLPIIPEKEIHSSFNRNDITDSSIQEDRENNNIVSNVNDNNKKVTNLKLVPEFLSSKNNTNEIKNNKNKKIKMFQSSSVGNKLYNGKVSIKDYMNRTNNSIMHHSISEPKIKKAISFQGLKDLEKTVYFPATPKQFASGVQRGLKDSVINDMCRAVVKQMVGDIYVISTDNNKKVINHLYEPVLQSVQNHFKKLPARYALSVNPDDVPMHIRLLSKQERNPEGVSLHAHWTKEDDGRGLTSMKGSIIDADVMTTKQGFTLDRFVVKGDFVLDKRLTELKRRIIDNLDVANNTDSEKGASLINDLRNNATDKNSVTSLGIREMVGNHDIRPEWKLEFSEISLERPIGNGRSGVTYLARWRGMNVAAKIIKVSSHDKIATEEMLNEFQQEMAVVSRLRHPNIVLFLGAASQYPTYSLIFEYMENGTLTDLLRRRNYPIDFFRISNEISKGMNYLHLCSIIHRDLKSGNVLIDSHGTVKVSDFGLSCVFDSGNSNSDLTAETGTYRWMAPEVIRHEPYSNKVDVYSFGIVLWEMIAKEQPFKGMTPIQAAFAVARQMMRPTFPPWTPPSLAELVELCWHHDPLIRPSFSDIIEYLPLIQQSLRTRDLQILGFKL